MLAWLERWGPSLPAVLNSPSRILMALDEVCHDPMDVVSVEPVVIDGDTVLQVLNHMMPAAGDKDDIAGLL
eukprot:scaffold456451_cov34-Prasinocladus_malaysianus.AAC.1